MDFNEEIDSADASRRKELLEQIEGFQEKAMADLQEHFVSKRFEDASESLAKIKYFENLKNRLS